MKSALYNKRFAEAGGGYEPCGKMVKASLPVLPGRYGSIVGG